MIYRLSNGQKKQLLIRGGPLTIAVPAPADIPASWIEWARHSFIDEGKYITGVRIDHIVVTTPAGDGLAGVIGAIVHAADPDPSRLTWAIEVAILHFDPPNAPRHARTQIQWPAMAECDGRRWPAARKDSVVRATV